MVGRAGAGARPRLNEGDAPCFPLRVFFSQLHLVWRRLSSLLYLYSLIVYGPAVRGSAATSLAAFPVVVLENLAPGESVFSTRCNTLPSSKCFFVSRQGQSDWFGMVAS